MMTGRLDILFFFFFENFYESLFEPKSKISSASQNNSFAASFMHLKFRRKQGANMTGRSKAGIGLQDS